MPGNFFDTNVLLYIASGDPAKADRAEELKAKAIEAVEAYGAGYTETRAASQPLIDAVRSVEQDGCQKFGERSGFDLGSHPHPPAIIGGPRHRFLSPLDELKQAPSPLPAGIREPWQNRDRLPQKVLAFLGISEEPDREPERESVGDRAWRLSRAWSAFGRSRAAWDSHLPARGSGSARGAMGSAPRLRLASPIHTPIRGS